MARVRLRRNRIVIPEKYVLLIMTGLCIFLMIITYFLSLIHI